MEATNANSKVESPCRSTPDRKAAKSDKINSVQFSTPTEVLDIIEPIATLAFAKTQPSILTDESRKA